MSLAASKVMGQYERFGKDNAHSESTKTSYAAVMHAGRRQMHLYDPASVNV